MDAKEKKLILKKWWFWVICIVAVAGVIGAVVSGGKPATNTTSNLLSQLSAPDPSTDPKGVAEEKIEYIEVSAGILLNAYEENEIAADGNYKGKNLKISGIVKDIGKDILDNAYVTVQGEDSGIYDFKSVQCFFDDNNLDAISSLKAGDKITITGLCDGTILGINIRLDKCNVE